MLIHLNIIVQLLLPYLKATSLNPPTDPTTLETASAAAMVAGKMPPKKQTRKPRREEKRFAKFHQNKTKSYQTSAWPISIIHLTTTQNHFW